MKVSLALVMITLNEEQRLAKCLRSAASFVDEIIVVDTGSKDGTIDIAKQYGAKVVPYSWTKDFSAARNFALSHSSCEWNLILDADEYIESFDREAVNRFMVQSESVGRIHRISETVDRGESSYTSDYITRLIPAGMMYKGRIHEQVDTTLSRKNVPIVVSHDGYLGTNKSSRNIPILLEELEISPNDSYYRYQLAKEYNGINRIEESLTAYEDALRRLSYRERYAPNVLVDYMYALNKAGNYEKLYDIMNQESDFVSQFPDYHFACGVIYLDMIIHDQERYITLLPRIEQAYKRCLAIGETEQYDTVQGTGSYAALYNLGNYYEVLGQTGLARECYRQASELGYDKASRRLNV